MHSLIQAYLLFYETADASDDPEVRVQGFKGLRLSSFQSATDSKQNPCKENIQIQQATPPSIYITEPCFDVRAAAVCKTAKGSPGLQDMSICDAEKSKLNLLLRWDIPSKTIPEQKVGKSKIYVDFCQEKKRGEQLCP